LGVIKTFTLLSGFDTTTCALIEAVVFADGDFERGHGVFFLEASYSDQSIGTGVIFSNLTLEAVGSLTRALQSMSLAVVGDVVCSIVW